MNQLVRKISVLFLLNFLSIAISWGQFTCNEHGSGLAAGRICLDSESILQQIVDGGLSGNFELGNANDGLVQVIVNDNDLNQSYTIEDEEVCVEYDPWNPEHCIRTEIIPGLVCELNVSVSDHGNFSGGISSNGVFLTGDNLQRCAQAMLKKVKGMVANLPQGGVPPRICYAGVYIADYEGGPQGYDNPCSEQESEAANSRAKITGELEASEVQGALNAIKVRN